MSIHILLPMSAVDNIQLAGHVYTQRKQAYACHNELIGFSPLDDQIVIFAFRQSHLEGRRPSLLHTPG
jgi:hypothetical protein